MPDGPNRLGGNPELASIAKSIRAISDANTQLVGDIRGMIEDFTQLIRQGDVFHNTMRSIVNDADQLQQLIKTGANLQKQFLSGVGKQDASYKTLLQTLRQLVSINRQVVASNPKPADARLAEANIKKLSDAYINLSKAAGGAGGRLEATKDELNELKGVLADVSRGTNHLATSVGRINMGHLERQVATINRHLYETGNRMKIFDDIQDSINRRKSATEYAQARAEHKKELTQEMVGKATGAGISPQAQEALLRLGLSRKQYSAIQAGRPAPATPLERTGVAAARTENYDELAKVLSGRSGAGGFVDKILGSRALKQQAVFEAGGEAPDFVSRATGRAMQSGGGSAVTGALSQGIEAIPAIGGAYSILESITKVIMKFIDTSAAINASVEKSLGGSLIGGATGPGGQGVGPALAQVTKNLRAPELITGLGVTLEKNLSVAQAMQESGLDVSDLTKQQGFQKGRGVGDNQLLTGAFGQFQRGSYIFGRAAGLTDTQTVKEMTKFIYEMRQGFEATEDFLAGVTSQAKVAGLSTTKYLSIVEDLTGHFDKMNKSFNETVSILQTLGRTGSLTADSMKDMVGALTGAGEGKTTEQTAFALAMMTKGSKQNLVDSQRRGLDDSIMKLEEGLKTRGGFSQGEIDALDLKNHPENISQVQNMLIARTGLTGPTRTALMGQQQESYSRLGQLGIAQQIQKGNYVGAAIAIQALGKNARTGMGIEASIMGTVLKESGISLADIRKNPAILASHPIAAPLMQALGKKPEDLLTYGQAAGTITGAGLLGGVDKLPEGKRELMYQKFFKAGIRAGIFKDEKQSVRQMEDLIKEQTKTPEGFAKLAGAIEDISDPEMLQDALEEALTKVNKDRIGEEAKTLAERSRPMAEIFASAFEYLFTKFIYAPLSSLTDFLYKIPGLGGAPTTLATDKTGIRELFHKAAQEGKFEKARAIAERTLESTTAGSDAKSNAKAFLDLYTKTSNGQAADADISQKTAKDLLDRIGGIADDITKMMAADITDPTQLRGVADPNVRKAAAEQILSNAGIKLTKTDQGDVVNLSGLTEQQRKLALDTKFYAGDVASRKGDTITYNVSSTSIKAYQNQIQKHRPNNAGETATPPIADNAGQ